MATQSKKVLIVEDERPMARALELKLNHEGFEATVITNGESAVDTMKKGGFDVVILDLVMPKKDGFEVLEEAQANKISVPIIILSNLGQEEDKKKALALGARDFFIKSNTPIASIVSHIKKITS